MTVFGSTMRLCTRLKIALQRLATLRSSVLEYAWLHGFRVFQGGSGASVVERPSAKGGLWLDTHTPKDLRS